MARGRGQGRPWRGRGAGGSLGGGGRTTGGPRNRGPVDLHTRKSSHTIAKPFHRTNNLPWQKSLMKDGLRATGLLSGLDTGTKLYVSNLDILVSNNDIRELFSEMGELIRYAIHYDKYGRTTGSAEVVFARRSDAMKAFKRYNNVLLDGRPMKIEVVGTKAEFPLLADRDVLGGANGRKVVTNKARGPARTKGAAAGAMQGSGQRGGGRRGRRRGRGWKKSADELDKELDDYHA